MKVDFCTDTVKKYNEDTYGLTRLGAFVIDGASALTEKSYLPSGNDVAWLVQWWKGYLEEHLDDTSHSIQEILKEGISRLNKEVATFVDLSSLQPHEKLSAGIAVVRKNGQVLETFILGDVKIFIEQSNGQMAVLTDESINRLDEQVIQLMARDENREDRIVFKGFTQEELDLLNKNRSKMNQPDGYYILSHCEEAVDQGIYKTFSVECVERVLLATDGLNPLQAKYTKKDLLETIWEKGASALIQELRKLEKADKDKTRIGRLKTHDDATLIYLDFRGMTKDR